MSVLRLVLLLDRRAARGLWAKRFDFREAAAAHAAAQLPAASLPAASLAVSPVALLAVKQRSAAQLNSIQNGLSAHIAHAAPVANFINRAQAALAPFGL